MDPTVADCLESSAYPGWLTFVDWAKNQGVTITGGGQAYTTLGDSMNNVLEAFLQEVKDLKTDYGWDRVGRYLEGFILGMASGQHASEACYHTRADKSEVYSQSYSWWHIRAGEMPIAPLLLVRPL